MPTTAASLTDLAETLREARERAGLTQRALAEAMGVSRATVAEAELGADLRASTLQRALDVLVAVAPGRLLTGVEGAPPVCSEAAWRLQARLSGFVVRRLVRAVALDETAEGELVSLAALGVRPLVGSLDDAAMRRALMRAVYRGTDEALDACFEANADTGLPELEVADGPRTHSFRFPKSLDESGFDYERREPAAGTVTAERFLSYTPGHAIETLELVLEGGEAGLPVGAHYEAHAGGRRGDGDGRWLAEALRPEGLRTRRTTRPRRLVAEIARPESYVTHEWHADERPEEPPPRDLRSARESAGWSRRELARRIGVSPMTVANAESGRDVRCSTWRACLRELPELKPERLLDGRGPDRVATRAEAWAHERQLHGLAADEEHKELVIDSEGWAEAVYRTRNLRSLRPRPDGLIVRYGASRMQPAGRSTPPDTIEQDGPETEWDEGLRTRLIRGGGGQVVHELRFSDDAAERGVSYTRRIAKAWHFSLEASDETNPRDGHGFAAAFPVRRLRVSTHFPPELTPEGLRAHCRPAFFVPGHDERLEELLHPDGLELRVCHRSGVVELVVDEPLVGIRYGVTWLTPTSD